MNPETSNFAREVDHAMLLICGVSILLLVGITAAMVLFAIRFRRGKARTTSQRGGNTALEIAWTVIPTIIVVWMFFVGHKGFSLMRRPPEGALEVEVTGKQWVWTFHYPEENVDSTELVVPVGQPVKAIITSPADDVIHSLYIPEFRVKEDAVPGVKSWMWFLPEEEGVFNIFCAEFCGKDHSKMITLLRVVSDEDWRTWVQEQRLRKLRPISLEDLTTGKDDPENPNSEARLLDGVEPLYRTFCSSCHGDAGDGSGLPRVARDFRSLEGWRGKGKEADIFRTLTTGIPGTEMRSYPNLSGWQKVALAKYVQTFNPNAPEDTEEEYKALVEEYSLDKIQPPRETIPLEKAMEILAREAREGK